MSDATLYVDEQTMRETASTFDSTGHDVSGNRAGPVISGAAGSMPSLAVGAACGTVGSALTEQAKLLGSDVTVYAQKLRVAADRYERGDDEAAERIDFTGTAELPDAGEHPPVSDYEKALRDAGLLTGPVVPGSKYAQWLENASKRGVDRQTMVDIARAQNITPQSFDVLNGLQEVKDKDGKSFFILPPGTSKEDAKKAVVMTYILNAGTDYDAAEAGADGKLGTADDVRNDFAETPYSAAEVQRIVDRQNANSWSYDQIFDKGGGGSLATTPNGMLMGLGGPVMDKIGVHGGDYLRRCVRDEHRRVQGSGRPAEQDHPIGGQLGTRRQRCAVPEHPRPRPLVAPRGAPFRTVGPEGIRLDGTGLRAGCDHRTEDRHQPAGTRCRLVRRGLFVRSWLAVLLALLVAAGLTACRTGERPWSDAPSAAPMRPAFGARVTDGKLEIWMPPGCAGVRSVEVGFGFGPKLVLTDPSGTATLDRFTVGGPYPGLTVTEAPPPDFDWRTEEYLFLNVQSTPGGYPATARTAEVAAGSNSHPAGTFYFEGVGWLDAAGVTEKEGKEFAGVCRPQQK